MFSVIFALVRALAAAFQSREQLVLENLALRHQLLVLHRTAARPQLNNSDRLLWLFLRMIWAHWERVLTVVQPQTVIGWHRAGFRLFWRWRSRGGGRPQIDRDLIDLIRQMWQANPTWGSPRIRDELAKLGLQVSDSTVRKYRPKGLRSTSQSWRTFLRNHAKQIIAVDFFTVPTLTFRVLFVFVILAHERRKVLHFAVTETPSAFWAGQQLVDAFPFQVPPRYLLRDRDGIYGAEFGNRVAGLAMEQKLISAHSPWQNPYVERLIGTFRRECLDHVIVLNQQHLDIVLHDYLEYYHRSRTHRSLARDCPIPRPVEDADGGKVIELPLLGGLHHRYTRQAA